MKKILFTALIFIYSNHLAIAQNDSRDEMVKKFVQIIGDQIIETAKDKKLTEVQKKQKIIDITDKSSDTKWIGRFVLGKHYKTASEEQRKNFMELYREFMINTYGPKFSDYDGKKFSVNSVEKQSGFYLVKSEFIPKNSNSVIFIDFRVRESDGVFSIVDYIAEGVSLIETQRSEFNSSINEKGLDNFLSNLKQKIDNLKIENNNPKKKVTKK